MTTAEDQHDNINATLTGPMTPSAQKARQEITRTGKRPPVWWHGDEDASQQSIAAMRALRG